MKTQHETVRNLLVTLLQEMSEQDNEGVPQVQGMRDGSEADIERVEPHAYDTRKLKLRLSDGTYFNIEVTPL